MLYHLTLQREIGKKTNDERIEAQIDHILERGLGGSRGKTWTAQKRRLPPMKRDNGGWVFTYQIQLQKTGGQRGGEAEYKQWEEIRAMIHQTGQAAKYQPGGWRLITNANGDARQTPQDQTAAHTARVAASADGITERVQAAIARMNSGTDTPAVASDPVEPASFDNIIGEASQSIMELIGVKTVQPYGKAKSWSDLVVPADLLGENSDEAIRNHPAWKNLYGVNPQIRILLSNIQRAHHTSGESRNHAVLFGHAGCGKTTTMFALEHMFGSDAVLKLDATSTTRAGLEKLFFSDLTEIPPLVFMEEAEKADPEALKIWLGALDDRGEIRKVNFRVNQLRQVKVLFICSVNNKSLFDKMMGSDGSEAGALSSRCVTQIYYPRPSDAVLFQILDKEIREKGGRHEWIAPAVEMAKELGVSDPRIVRSYLAGGDRLLDKAYQRDWLAVHEAQAMFNKKVAS